VPQADTFSFFGFDDIMPDVVRSMRHVEIRGGEPGVAVVENAVYIPADQTGRSRRERGALAHGFASEDAVPSARAVDEDVVYLGWLYNHYGHCLMQSLARTWFLAEAHPSVKVVFHHPGRSGWQPAGWVPRLLEAFGISRDRVLMLHEPTRLRRLFVPEPLFEPRSTAADRTTVRVHEAMAEPYQAVARRIVGDLTPSGQPLYLSRRLLPIGQRQMIGEDELEAVLRQNGFRIAHPETMSLPEQIRLINSHRDIVSNAGSAAQNVLFALHAPRLHLLTSGPCFSPDYFMHHTLVGARTSFVNCLGTDGRETYPAKQTVTPHLVDVATCVAYLKARGFLSTPPVAPSSPNSAQVLRAQYDEVWLYGRVRTITVNGKELPRNIRLEALRVATSSWPVSLSLALYCAARDDALLDEVATQFAMLVARERDSERLARYRADAKQLVRFVKRRRSATAARVAHVVSDRFADDRDLSDDGFDRSDYETGVAASRGRWDKEKTWAAKDATHEVEKWDDLATWQSRDD